MVGPDRSRPRTWRRQFTTVWFLLLPGLSSLFTAVRYVLRLAGDEPVDFDDVLTGWVSLVVTIGCLGVFAFAMIRGRVQLLADELEVRNFTTRRYPYDDITEVFIDRASSDRVIKIIDRNGRGHFLPAPTRGLRKPSDTTLVDAVTAIRARLET